ncbi:MAG: hypothetical protein IPN33_25775 [Saprospiraceae bacterium]|nr:hypothetical protein [Saprospiraceae bacterium]
MKTTAIRPLYLLLWAMLLLSAGLMAQTDKALLRELAEDNQKSVEALALYPRDTRLAILEACQYPEIIVKMNHEREKTAAAFRNLLEDYPRATQEVWFDLTRYPGLIERLADARESEAAYRDLLKVLPQNKQAEALEVVWNSPGILRKIDALNQTARRTFENLTDAYPAPARQAFDNLLETPEVLEILNEDLRFTIMIGDLYRSEPEATIRQTDSLNLAVAREHAQELDDWKNTLQNDPEAQSELQAAAREYADEYDYPYDDYTDYYTADEPGWFNTTTTTTIPGGTATPGGTQPLLAPLPLVVRMGLLSLPEHHRDRGHRLRGILWTGTTCIRTTTTIITTCRPILWNTTADTGVREPPFP